MRTPFRNPFDSEAEVAALVREALESLGWEVHPECNGWDLFAVARSVEDRVVHPGDTLGVECKLDAGRLAGLESLMRQALPMPGNGEFYRPLSGPHFRAVAAPRIAAVSTFRGFGVAAWQVARLSRWSEPTGWHRREGKDLLRELSWFGRRFDTQRPPRVPEIVVNVPAGVPSPQTSSPWKIAAVRMMLRLRAGEAITSADFAAAGLNVGRFRQLGWIRDTGRRIGRRYVWGPGEGRNGDRPPDQKWPQIAEALLAKERVRSGERSTPETRRERRP